MWEKILQRCGFRQKSTIDIIIDNLNLLKATDKNCLVCCFSEEPVDLDSIDVRFPITTLTVQERHDMVNQVSFQLHQLEYFSVVDLGNKVTRPFSLVYVQVKNDNG